jgi:5-formyltetrahydrofolate cyclo-ligase
MVRPEMGAAAEHALRVRAKEELRRRMRSLRRVLPAEGCAARSAAICARLCELEAFSRATTVVGYVAFRKEADPQAALRSAEAAGKRVGLVRVEEDGALGLHRYASGDPLCDNAYGIAEPAAGAPRIAHGEVSLVIVPALCVDARGHRIGYGQGFYDRLLPKLDAAFKAVIAYDFQLLAELPSTEGDVAVDCIITEKRTLLCGGPPAP